MTSYSDINTYTNFLDITVLGDDGLYTRCTYFRSFVLQYRRKWPIVTDITPPPQKIENLVAAYVIGQTN